MRARAGGRPVITRIRFQVIESRPMPVLIVVFLLALLVGVPVFIALAGSALIYTHFIAGIPDFVILHRMAGGMDSFPLLAVPFFILSGNLMNSAGVPHPP